MRSTVAGRDSTGSSPASYRWRRRSSTRYRLACGFPGWPVGVDMAVRTPIKQAQGFPWHFTLWTPFRSSASLQESNMAHTCSCHSEGQSFVHGHVAHVQRGRIQIGLCQCWTSSLSQGQMPLSSSLPACSFLSTLGLGVVMSCHGHAPQHKGHRGVLLPSRCHASHVCSPPYCPYGLTGSETSDPALRHPQGHLLSKPMKLLTSRLSQL